MIKRNPGLCLVWVTKSYKLFKTNPGDETYFLCGGVEGHAGHRYPFFNGVTIVGIGLVG